ncbi:hypothetical protein FKP32DRAFT_1593718 [Trametes sanguinea]|nr:hypothetical protein FKP32DRAFT_1593718 [Trametes sanguinea]
MGLPRKHPNTPQASKRPAKAPRAPSIATPRSASPSSGPHAPPLLLSNAERRALRRSRWQTDSVATALPTGVSHTELLNESRQAAPPQRSDSPAAHASLFTSAVDISPPPGPRETSPPRPPSPDAVHIALGTSTWRRSLVSLCSRLNSALYVDDGEHRDLPQFVYNHIGDLKFDGFGTQDTVDNMCALLQYLRDDSSQERAVEGFVERMRTQRSWPDKLQDKPPSQHAEYAWMLLSGLLAVKDLPSYLEPNAPPTFSEIVKHIFPLPHGAALPARFSLTARGLVEDGFTIQPTANLLDHLKLVGNTITIYTLEREAIRLLIDYRHNRAARAIGLGDLCTEYMHSYVALVEGELHESYRLPISLGIFKINDDDVRTRRGQYDDLTLITRVIRMYRNTLKSDRTPRLLASRVLAIEAAQRERRRWYHRLRRDIWKRTKAAPWIVLGTVFALAVGIGLMTQAMDLGWTPASTFA